MICKKCHEKPVARRFPHEEGYGLWKVQCCQQTVIHAELGKAMDIWETEYGEREQMAPDQAQIQSETG